MWKKLSVLSLLISTLILSNCAAYDFSRKVTQQGNLLPQSKIQRLKVGMTKEDVSILMGSSLLGQTFNTNRWDYAYTWRKGNSSMDIHYVSIYFVNGRVSRIEHSKSS